MKKMNDVELQKWMEENRLASPGKKAELPDDDAKAYQILFDALNTEPLQGLPYDFPAKVTRRVRAENKRSSELRFYIWGLAIFVLAIAIISGGLMLIKPTAKIIYLDFLLQYKWVFIFGIFSFLTIQYLDQVLVKANIFKRH